MFEKAIVTDNVITTCHKTISGHVLECEITRFQSLHRPIKTICRAPWVDDFESGLRINHYLGSWEGEPKKYNFSFAINVDAFSGVKRGETH